MIVKFEVIFWGGTVRRELKLVFSMSMVHMYTWGCVDV